MNATRALNNQVWSKYISVNTKKQMFYTVTESILSWCWEIWAMDYKLKKKLFSTKMDFWTSTLRKRKKVIREKMLVTKTILERLQYNMLKWYGHVECMEDNRWPK